MKHYDCKYYLAVDAFKGVCKRNRDNILADDNACENFEKAAKCVHCDNFTSTEDEIGLCMDTHQAYPQMSASTCDDFKWL